MNISLAQTYHIDKKHIAVKSSFNYGLANRFFNKFQGQFNDNSNYEAYKSIEGALTNRPGYSEYLKEKSYLLQRLGYSDDALKLYQQSIKYRKRNDVVQVTSQNIANMRKPGYNIHMDNSHSTSTHQMTSNHFMSIKSRRGKPHRIKRMMVIAGIAFAFAMATNPINAQTLKMQLIEPNSNPAKGTIVVTGSDTVITDSAFEGEATYILNTATSTEMLTKEALRLYPNPAGQCVTLDVPQGSIGRLEVHDFTGRLLGVAPYGITSVVVPVNTGVVLLTWIDQNGQQSLRLVCSGKKIGIRINTTESSTVTFKSKSAGSDDYIIDFSDPTENIEDKQWSRTIHLGESITINETIEYTIKDLLTQFSEIGTNVNIDVDGIIGTTNANGNAEITLQERISKEDSILVNINYNGENVEEENYDKWIKKGTNQETKHANKIYKNKTNATSGKEANITITDIHGNPLSSGQIGEEITFNKRTDEEEIIKKINKENYIEQTKNQTVKPGLTTETIALTGKYTTKINNTKTGTNITWKDDENNTLLSGTNETQIYQELPKDSTNIKAIIEYTNYINDTIKFINAKPGITEKEAEQMIGKYTTRINNTKENANISWKDLEENIILAGINETEIYQELPQDENTIKAIIEFTNYVNDTIKFVNTIPGITEKEAEQMIGKFNRELLGTKSGDHITWKDINNNELLSGINATTLYEELAQDTRSVRAEVTRTNYVNKTSEFLNKTVGLSQENIEQMTGKYTTKINNAKENANITWKDDANNTLLSGINAINLYEEIAKDSTNIKAIIEYTNYLNDTIKFVNTKPGITEKEAEQMTGKYTTKLTNVIPGTNITWKDNENNTIITGQNIIELYQELPTDSTNIKAILELANHVNDTITYTNIKPGITEKDTEQEAIENEYTLNLIITEVTGDTILTGKTINIKEPNGETQSKTITNKNTNFTIQGNYTNEEKIQMWLTNDNEYDGLTGTINQSLKLPLSSVYDKNETKQDTLTVIIGDVNNKTAYVSFMNKNTRDDPNIQSIGEEGGNSEYNHLNEQGEREQNIILAKTSKQGTPVPEDIKGFYNQAVEMHTSKYTTAQGLELITVNYDSIPGYPTSLPEGTFYLLVDNDMTFPGNVKTGNMPETFNKGYVKLRSQDNQNINISVSEVGEGIIPLKDAQGAGNMHYFESDNEGIVQDVKIKPLRIALMYKGLSMPDPTQ